MSNANVGKVFNMTGGNGGGGTLRLETLTIRPPTSPESPLTPRAWSLPRAMGMVSLRM